MYPVSKSSGKGGTSAPCDREREAELIERCRAGERGASEELYRLHRRNVAANLYRVLGNRDDLEDLVQEVFIIAFKGLDSFRGDARLSTWLYRVCVNVALARIRARKRRPPPVPLSEHALETLPAPGDPGRSLQQKQSREKVYRALDRLSAKKRIVLYLHEIEGHDLKEIAYIVGAHPVTVRTRLYYARREFYRLVIEDES